MFLLNPLAVLKRLWGGATGTSSTGPIDAAAVGRVQDPYDRREQGLQDIPLDDLSQSRPVANRSGAAIPATNVTIPTTGRFRFLPTSSLPTLTSFVGLRLPPPAYGEHTNDRIALDNGHNLSVDPSNATTTNAAVSDGPWYGRISNRLREGFIIPFGPLTAPPFIVAIPGFFVTDAGDAAGERDPVHRPRRLGWLTGNWRNAWIVVGSALLISLPLTITLTMNGDMSEAQHHIG